LTGIQGETGVAGTRGETGSIGATGANGIRGQTGLQGVQGDTGVQGATGIGGIGATGIKGDTGFSGPQGATGVMGPQGLTGVAGAGLTGLRGETGVAGVQGATGIGIIGQTGIQGETGVMGLQGSTGIRGEVGAVGLQGHTGVAGIQGATGIGVQGIRGETGIIGIQGMTGVGSVGATGVVGIQGQTGLAGPQGDTGVGVHGQTGSQGSTGIAGAKGETGVQGLTGPSAPAVGVVYNTVSKYAVVTTAGEEVWIQTSSAVYTGLAWSRSTTSMTMTRSGHGHSVGDRVIVRNTNVDHQIALIDSITTNTFTFTTNDTGATLGIQGAYSLGFTYNHIGNPKTGGIMYAPTGDHADVQLISMRIRTGTRLGAIYTLKVPQSAINGGGSNTYMGDVYMPDFNVRFDTETMAAVASSMYVNNLGAGYSQFEFQALGTLSRFILLHF
jgi:hypothetical protein